MAQSRLQSQRSDVHLSVIHGTHNFVAPPGARCCVDSCNADPSPLQDGRGPGALVGWRPYSPAPPHAPALPAPPDPASSVAKCLGARTVAAQALECTREFKIFSEVVEDVEAVRAVQQFLGE